MAGIELWISSVHVPGQALAMARRAEEYGYDGIGFGDTQNLAADPYIGLALAAQATTTLRLGVRVANPITRDAAVTAGAIATVQLASGGRAVLGVGRGDSSVTHIDGRPASVSDLASYVQALQGYLGGGPAPGRAGQEPADANEVPGGAGGARSGAGVVREGGRPVRPLSWLPSDLPKVPVDVAATGERTIAVGALLAESITINVGADPTRVTETVGFTRACPRPSDSPPLSLGAYVNVVPHPDLAVARELVRGPAAAYARFSGLTGAVAGSVRPDDREVFATVASHYDRRAHGRSSASHCRLLPDEFLSRFAVVGSVDHCVERLAELVGCGLERLVLVGPAPDGDPAQVAVTLRLLGGEVVPAVRADVARRHGDQA